MFEYTSVCRDSVRVHYPYVVIIIIIIKYRKINLSIWIIRSNEERNKMQFMDTFIII